jgi:hypothetical protein
LLKAYDAAFRTEDDELDVEEHARYWKFMVRMTKGIGKHQSLLDRFDQLLRSWGIDIQVQSTEQHEEVEEPEKTEELQEAGVENQYHQDEEYEEYGEQDKQDEPGDPEISDQEERLGTDSSRVHDLRNNDGVEPKYPEPGPEELQAESDIYHEEDESESPALPENYAEMEQRAIEYRNQIAMNKFFRGMDGHLAGAAAHTPNSRFLPPTSEGTGYNDKHKPTQDFSDMQRKAEQVTMEAFKRLLQARKLNAEARPAPLEGETLPGRSVKSLDDMEDDDSEDSPTPPANFAELEQKAIAYAASHSEKRFDQLRAASKHPKAQIPGSLEMAEPPIAAATLKYLDQLVEEFRRERDLNLIHKAFTHWAVLASEAREMTALAKRHIQRKRVFGGWLNLTLESNARVDFFVLRKCLHIWMKRHYQIIEDETGAPCHAENVLLVRCLGLFVHHLRTIQDREAAAIEHSNSLILRKTFTVWNLRLRAKYYEGVVIDRFLSDAFYKWRIAARASRHSYESERKIKRKRLESWRSKAQRKRIEAENAAQRSAENRRRALAVRVLGRWKRFVEKQRARNATATAFREQRLSLFAMKKLRDQTGHLNTLVEMAVHADYYFLAHRALQQWHAALVNRRREQRRAAYIEVRTNIKKNLARNILNNIREVAGHIMVMDQQATDHAENLFLSAVVSDLSTWRAKTRNIVETTEQVQSTYDQRLLSHVFYVWRERNRTITQHQQIASTFSASWAQLVAAECLRTWSRKIFQLEGHADMAEKLKGKNMKSTMGSILRHWAQLARSKRQSRLHGVNALDDQGGHAEGGGENAIAQHTIEHGNDGEFPGYDDDDRLPGEETIHRRVQEWGEVAFDDSKLPLDLNLNPQFVNQDFAGLATPGYMRTPSKRTVARSRMLERIRTLNGTPAVVRATGPRVPGSAPARQQTQAAGSAAPAVTSFQTKLQAQGYSPDPMAIASTGRGRGKQPARRVDFAGFDDIAE